MKGSPFSTIVKKCTGSSSSTRLPSSGGLEEGRRTSAVRLVISCRLQSRLASYETPGSTLETSGNPIPSREVLTIFTVPKPFCGRVGDIQRNAIESWIALRHDVQVVLVGDEEGVEQSARDAGAEHVGGLALNSRGTPRLDSAFERTATVARRPLWCYVNADVLLLDDLVPAVERVASTFTEFLVIGECRDLDVAAGTRLSDRAVRSQLRESALSRGRLRGYAALDYFVFRRGLFNPVPPFLIGRAHFDNWLVWRARERNCPVIDATRSVVAIHQSHDYAHVTGGLDEAYGGPEARHNKRLAGGREHIYSLHDATHRLHPEGQPVRYWGSTFRIRERSRRARETVDLRLAARRARKGFQRPIRLLAVYAEPSTEATVLLDTLARTTDVDLSVLYAANAATGGSTSTHQLRHVHWFPRSLRHSRIDRIVGREYPVNWAIWKSFHALRPDCMIIAGWDAFATQAAIAWCLARRVPFLLLADANNRELEGVRNEGFRKALAATVARRADTVMVPRVATTESLIAYGVREDRHKALPEATDAAAAQVLDVARSAWINGSTPVHLASGRDGF